MFYGFLLNAEHFQYLRILLTTPIPNPQTLPWKHCSQSVKPPIASIAHIQSPPSTSQRPHPSPVSMLSFTFPSSISPLPPHFCRLPQFRGCQTNHTKTNRHK
ncbi:hypothetical protein Droror1_Dr00009281 [Drosera rotundifolia]